MCGQLRRGGKQEQPVDRVPAGAVNDARNARLAGAKSFIPQEMTTTAAAAASR